MSNPAPVPTRDEAFLHAQRLAAVGKYQCRGPCGQVGDLKDGVGIHYGGALAFAICTNCFLKVDVVLSRGGKGIEIKLAERRLVVVRP